MKLKVKTLCLITCVSLVLSSCNANKTTEVLKEEINKIPIEVMSVTKSLIQNEYIYSGKVKPQDEINVLSTVAGKVNEVFFDIGDSVNEGDILFTMDTLDIENNIKVLRASLSSTEANIKSAKTNLELVNGSGVQLQIENAKSGVNNALSALESSKLNLTNAEIGVNNAKLSFDTIKFNVENAEIGLKNGEIGLKNADITLKNAEIGLKNTDLVLENAKLSLENAKTNYETNKILYEAHSISKNVYEQYETAYNQAQISYDQVKLSYDQSQLSYEQAKLAHEQAELGYNQAETAYNQAKFSYNQAELGLSQAEVAYQQAKLSYSQAETAYNQAKDVYSITANQMPAENKRKAQDAVTIAEASKDSILAQIESAEKTLNDAIIRSPISGIITGCNIKAGTVLAQTTAAPFTIINMNSVNIEVNVSEQIINNINLNQLVDIKVASISETPFQGVINKINPSSNATGTYGVTIKINNPDNSLKAGMFGEVYFTRDKKEDTIVLPRNIVISKNNETYVYIEENGIAKKIYVSLGVDNGNEIEIVEGIEEGMNVIIKGQTYLSDGDNVEVVAIKNDNINLEEIESENDISEETTPNNILEETSSNEEE